MSNMEQIAAQLSAIATQLSNLTEKQGQHDQLLTFLNEKIENTSIATTVATPTNTLDLFRIPDPIKSIPPFDGNKKQVTSWLKTAEETLRMFEGIVSDQQLRMYVQAIKNKVEGKARDILCLAGDPESFMEIKQILLEALGDRQELSYYKSQLWANKQNETMSIHSFYNRTKEIVQNIKSLAKQNQTYNASWHAISTFIEEDALAAFLSGLKKPYFGYAQAAKPKSLEEAYAFLCKFSSNENISNNSKRLSSHNAQPQKPGQYSVANSKFNQQTKQREINSIRRLNGPPTEHMEIDPSTRTRNSNMKKFSYNNHETTAENDDNAEVSNTETVDEYGNLDVGNFQEDLESDTES